MNQQNTINWFEIYVNDMERAKIFYQNVFQKGDFISLSDSEIKMFAFPFDQNENTVSGALVETDYMKAGIGGTLVYFNCDDCAVEESRVEINGGKIIKSKFSIGEFGFVCIAQDTEGNLIGLHSIK